jgi:hypothetical protein
MNDMTIRMFFGLVLAFALAACAPGGGSGGAVTTKIDYSTLYKPSLFQWVGDGRDVPVVIYGNPTPEPPDIWNRAVTDAMNRSTWMRSANFTTTPNETQRGNFFVVLIFGATSTMGSAAACQGAIDPTALGPVDGRTAILGAFCNNARWVTTARVTVNAITSSSAPQLQTGMNQMMIRLLPRYDPNRPDARGQPLLTY